MNRMDWTNTDWKVHARICQEASHGLGLNPQFVNVLEIHELHNLVGQRLRIRMREF